MIPKIETCEECGCKYKEGTSLMYFNEETGQVIAISMEVNNE